MDESLRLLFIRHPLQAAGLDIITALIRRVAHHCSFCPLPAAQACPAINMPHAPGPHILVAATPCLTHAWVTGRGFV